jgi:hypothetical protein
LNNQGGTGSSTSGSSGTSSGTLEDQRRASGEAMERERTGE